MFKKFSDTHVIGKHLIYLPNCHSTNDIASALIRNGKVEEGMVVITDFQTAGKGQRGNTWESEKERNLTFSIIVFPCFLKAEDNFFLNIVITLGVLDALVPLGIDGITIKWPNDIYFMNRKLGGILIENSVQSGFIESAVAGIGINVNQVNFQNPGAISLSRIFQKDLNRYELFHDIIRGIDKRYYQLSGNRMNELRQAYLSSLYRFNEPHLFRTTYEFTGIITGIDEYGRLLVKSEGKIKHYDLKEIEFLDE